MSHQLVFKLGITCQSCENIVHNALNELDFLKYGLSNPRINLLQKELFIDFEPTQTRADITQVQQAIIKSVENYGITCHFKSTDYDINHQIEPPEKQTHHYHWIQGGIGLTAGLGLMLVSIFTGGLAMPLMIAIGLASTALTCTLGYHSFINAYTHARYSQTLTMDTLFSISTLSVLTISICAFFIPGLPMMFEAGLMLFGFRHIGLGIEEAINHNSGVQRNFTDRLPKTVTLTNGKTIGVHDIQPEDEIILKNGAILPIDGYFIDANPSLVSVIRNGHDHPFKTKPNQLIKAGAVISDQEQDYIFKARKMVSNSYLAILDNLSLSAQQNKAPVENYTNKLLQYFIPGVLTIAVLSGLIVGIWLSPIMAIQCAAAVLVTACPCTLGAIVPMTMKIGMQKGLSHGVAFLSREAIEQATHINQVVFDLNGTLTQGAPQVRQCQILSNIPKPYVFELIYLLEKDANHPIGKCLAQFASDKLSNPGKVKFSNVEVTQFDNGCKATINIMEQSYTYYIGNAKCMHEQDIKIDEKDKKPSIYLAQNKQIIAKFDVIDPLRKDAKNVIQQLQQSGKTVFLLTGTDQATADFYGSLLDIPQTNRYANSRPEDKLERIKQLQKQGPVAMIGDGPNDKIPMQQSNLGIAMRSPLSDSITDQTAQVRICGHSMLSISHLFHVAQQTMTTLKQNLWFSFAYNAMALLLTGGVLAAAIGFAINPAVGACLMVLQTTIIMLNTYRFSQQKLSTQQANMSDTVTSISKLSSLRQSPVRLRNKTQPYIITKSTAAGISDFKLIDNDTCKQIKNVSIHLDI